MAVSQSSAIELAITLSPFLLLTHRYIPTVEINGKKESRDWGVHRLELPPGTYDVSVSYHTHANSECQKNTVRVDLEPGETRKITYRAGLLRFHGKMTLS